MANKPLPCISTIRKLVEYNPRTGLFTWRFRPDCYFNATAKKSAAHTAKVWNARFAEHPAFNILHTRGYLQGYIFTKKIFAHRLAWAMHYGAWPEAEIDHINGNRSDNRICNLRQATRSQNLKNAILRLDNTSGHVGVCFRKDTKKWTAQITSNGKNIRLGSFDTKEEAVSARAIANAKYGFHPNHGADDRNRYE